jgi:hypothetical protein
MRPLVNLIVILTFTTLTVAQERPPSASKTQQSDTESLIQLEKSLFKAHWTSDPGVVGLADKVLADDWVNLEPERRGPGKPEMMELLRRLYRDKATFPKPSPDMQQRNLQVFLFGNTAVATYFQEDTTKPDQHPLDVTDVFVKDGGTWKLRMSKASLRSQP